jgi:hypothetical protein
MQRRFDLQGLGVPGGAGRVSVVCGDGRKTALPTFTLRA